MALVALVAFHGCDPAQRHAVLSFFFDGVPDPIASQAVASADSVMDTTRSRARRPAPAEAVERISHPPYADGSCVSCHGANRSNALSKPQPELCYECHADFATQFTFLHGPVAGGYCTGCHEPHVGTRQKLLKRDGRDLCLFCHESDDVFRNEVHQDIDDADCSSCHNPHGGSDRFLM